VPDLLLCVAGIFVAIELKAPGKKASGGQKIEMARIIQAGGIACVVDNMVSFKAVLQLATKRAEAVDNGGCEA
jgi:hypothetical protein